MAAHSLKIDARIYLKSILTHVYRFKYFFSFFIASPDRRLPHPHHLQRRRQGQRVHGAPEPGESPRLRDEAVQGRAVRRKALQHSARRTPLLLPSLPSPPPPPGRNPSVPLPKGRVRRRIKTDLVVSRDVFLVVNVLHVAFNVAIRLLQWRKAPWWLGL